MKPFLMGEEVEYSMRGRRGKRGVPGEKVHDFLLARLRDTYRHVPDVCTERGSFLENSMRYYLDAGAHNEMCTPEVSTPTQLAVYDKAGERLLLEAARQAMQNLPGLQLAVTKYNIDTHFPDQMAWGTHESYTSWRELGEVAPQLLAHLVSRSPYASAGYLSEYPDAEGFELSQRARHLQCTTGSETTRNRAIFCTRLRKESDVSARGWQRAHLISKDSQRAPFGLYLTFGVTGLLFMLLNDGHDVGKGLELENPVGAMRQISTDPSLRTPVQLTDGRQLTAIDLQRSYFERASRLVPRGDYPDWAAQILADWQRTLDDLEQDPMRLSRRLDPYIKRALLDAQVQRANLEWADVGRTLTFLQMLRRDFTIDVVSALIYERDEHLNESARASLKAARKHPVLAKTRLEHLQFVARLQALEIQYHELGGLYDQLEQDEWVEPFLAEEEIRRAMKEPPPGGRAEQRSECIRNLADKPGWKCDWEALIHPQTGKVLDLRDPFSPDRIETTVEKLEQDPSRGYPMTRLIRLLG